MSLWRPVPPKTAEGAKEVGKASGVEPDSLFWDTDASGQPGQCPAAVKTRVGANVFEFVSAGLRLRKRIRSGETDNRGDLTSVCLDITGGKCLLESQAARSVPP